MTLAKGNCTLSCCIKQLFFHTIELATGPFYKLSLNGCNPITICVRNKIQMVSERRDNEHLGHIWCITVVQSIHKVLLSEHRQLLLSVHVVKSALSRFYHGLQ